MNAPLFLALAGNEAMAAALATKLEGFSGPVETRHFPDGETYLRIADEVGPRGIAIVATLDRPDSKILPLLFAADAARELGALSVGLIAPYLAYMRQDRRFAAGEAVTSNTFARLLSRSFDWLVTVDPHLHRHASLAELYTIPTKVVHAAPLLADWIARHVARPVLVGPDRESAQWVGEAAARIGAPFTVLDKERLGDRKVAIAPPDPGALGDRTPVLLDDIVSSGETLREAVRALRQVTEAAPVCVVVHALLGEEDTARFAAEGIRLTSADTVRHPSNAIEVAPNLAEALSSLPLRGV